jgi:hypothetical protein
MEQIDVYSFEVCVKIVLACDSVFQMMLSQGLKSSPFEVIAMSTQKVLTTII